MRVCTYYDVFLPSVLSVRNTTGSEHKQRPSTSSAQANGASSPAKFTSSSSRTYSASSRRTSRGTASRTGSESEMSVINSRMVRRRVEGVCASLHRVDGHGLGLHLGILVPLAWVF